MPSCLLYYIDCNMNTHFPHLRLTAIAVFSVIFLSLTSCGDDKVVSPSDSNTPGGNHSGSSDITSTTFDASLLIGSWKTTFVGNGYEILTYNTEKNLSKKDILMVNFLKILALGA